jgi:hypothetical protein
MAETRRQMAGSAAKHPTFGPVRNYFRHRGMFAGKPVWRIYEIVNLFLSVNLGAARDMLRAAPFIYNGLNLVADGKRPWNIRELPLFRGLSPNPQNGNEREDQDTNKNLDGNPHGSPGAVYRWSSEMPPRLLFRVPRVLAEMF